MILGLDVGNSQIYGGLFENFPKKKHAKMLFSFRKTSKQNSSSDEVGIFLRSVLRESGFDPKLITHIAICSVVPEVIHSIKGACQKYFGLEPFILQAGVKTGLKIKYRNPLEVGADRISNAIAASHMHPKKNLIVVDMGTATTFDVITSENEYLGGAIVPGLRLGMESLESKTAKLPSVEIVTAKEAVGRSTVESIQAGLYYGHVGTVREFVQRITKECFGKQIPIVIGTGGFSSLFEKEKLFDEISPDLVLQGLLLANELNLK